MTKCTHVMFVGVVHEQTDLLDGVDDVRTSESEVLESYSQTSIFSRILKL